MTDLTGLLSGSKVAKALKADLQRMDDGARQVYNCPEHGETVHVHFSGLVSPEHGDMDHRPTCDRCGQEVKIVKDKIRPPVKIESLYEAMVRAGVRERKDEE